MIAPEQYYPQPARDDLAFKMFAAWINCEPDKVPAQFKAWTCPQSRQAWERVAAAARADLAPPPAKVKALVEAVDLMNLTTLIAHAMDDGAISEEYIARFEEAHADQMRALDALAALEGGDG